MFKKLKRLATGISGRWLITAFGVLLPIVILLIVSICISVNSFCNSSIEQALSNTINELSATFPGYSCENTSDFSQLSAEYINNFTEKDNLKVEIINSSGAVTATSTGFKTQEQTEIPDYETALTSDNSFGKWTGQLSTGEKVLAVTKLINNRRGISVGAVRYIVSYRNVSFTVLIVALISSLIGLIIIAIMGLSGAYFLKSILDPVHNIRDTAKVIAGGDFSVKVTKMYDDEIGELCDSINDMAAELDASEKMKNDFISRVSHELRTPLAAIYGWADTMKSGTVDRVTYQKGLNVITHESLRLKKMVEELLDFSKLQSGRMQLNMQKIDLLAEVEEAVLTFKDRAKKEKKEFIYNEPSDLDIPPVYGDSDKIRQVFINILDNAFKYTPVHGLIGVKVYNDTNDGMVKVVVADNGYGIKKEDLPRIKKKFYKANQKIDGSGIGLAVADEIISLHKGVLDIDSTIDIGTTVTIGIPVYRESNNTVNS